MSMNDIESLLNFSGYINWQNKRMWATENPYAFHDVPL
jgi:hypothetical protein